MNVLLPAPDGPTRKTKSPRAIADVDVGQRHLAVGVGHADVDHADDRCVGGSDRVPAGAGGMSSVRIDGNQSAGPLPPRSAAPASC